MSQTTHISNVELTIFLEGQPAARKGFGTTLFMSVDPFPSSGAYASQRTAKFSDADSIKTAVDNGDLAHAYFKDLADELAAQTPQPFPVKIGKVDYNGGSGADYDASNPEDLYKNAYAACKKADGDFYGVCLDISRDGTTYINTDTNGDTNTETATGDQFMYQLAGALEGDRRVLILQSANGSWLTSGQPSNLLGDDGTGAGISAEGMERTAVSYHDKTFNGDSTTEFPPGSSSDTRPFLSTVWCSRATGFDPDETSAPWDLPVDGVSGLAADITGTERDHAVERNFANLGLPYGPAPMAIDPGKNLQGRPLYEIVSADWYYFRVQEDTAAKKVEYADRGEKIPVSKEGQEVVKGILNGRLEQGVRNGHFLSAEDGPDDYEGPTVTFPEITDTDKNKQRIRATVEGRFEVSARKFEFDVYFSR